jgi:hypothetical protein
MPSTMGSARLDERQLDGTSPDDDRAARTDEFCGIGQELRVVGRELN